MQGKIIGQLPSHWIATARSDREVDVHGIVTLKVDGGATYTAHVHEYMKFREPCVTINRHFWKVDYLEAEYYPDHWYYKEKAIVDPNWNYGPSKEKMTFNWHLFGNLGNKQITADGYGYGSGYRQHHWGKGGQGWGEHGLPNLNWALAWEGHAGMHFFTRFPKGVTNPFILSLPEGFVINRKWWGQDGAHWATTTSGTEPPSNSNSTTAPSTPATGKWTSTSENPWTRCPTHTLSSSGPRPGIPSPTTGTSTKERKSNSLHTTRSNRLNRLQDDRAQGRHCWVDLHTIIFYHGQTPENGNRNLIAAIPLLLVSNWDSILSPRSFQILWRVSRLCFAFVYHFCLFPIILLLLIFY